ncbi:MAG: Fic family protein [Verrucomicrobia bacterium]|nr:Fic family protein [Verrucomicrobiota bacterium]
MQLNELSLEIDSLKTEIEKLRPLKPELEQRVMQKFRLDWNYHSNAIEGNLLTLGETRAFLLEGLTASGKPLKDHLDIRGHDDLITFLTEFIRRNDRLTEAAIREMHKILLKEPYETDAITTDGRIVKKKVRLGEYKLEPNCVRMGSGEIHQYTSPQGVPPEMADLVGWHQKQEDASDSRAVVHAALFHHRFVSIHPFDDGNGRMARILMNLILMRNGFPPVVIKLQDRDPYVAALRRADAGETEGIVSFIGEKLIASENLFLRGARGESIEDADDVDKEIALLKQELSHVEPTLPFSRALQNDFLDKSAYPLLEKVEAKLKQFDDLFSSCSVDVSARLPMQAARPAKPGRPAVGPTQPLAKASGRRGAAGSLIKQLLTQHQVQIDLLTVVFTWQKFTRANLNTFDLSVSLEFRFEELQLQIKSNAPEKPLVTKRYAKQLTEEEMRDITVALARTALDYIKLKATPKNL